jgi:hypothetical protein
MLNSHHARCVAFLCLSAFSTSGFSQSMVGTEAISDPRKQILYTGQMDGLLGSHGICNGLGNPQACNQVIDQNARDLNEFKKSRTAILVGMGDNFAPDVPWDDSDPDGQYPPGQIVANRQLAPSSRVICLMAQTYDAVVPGREDFAFGSEYLRNLGILQAGAKDCGAEDRYTIPLSRKIYTLPLIANNLTVGVAPSSECLSYPTPAAALPLLPNQLANPLPTGSSAGSASSAGSGGGGGSSGSCPKLPSGQNNSSKPLLVWPNSSGIYPWTTSVAVSVLTDTTTFKPEKAFMCPAEADVSRAIPSTCITWSTGEAFAGTRLALAKSLLPTQSGREVKNTYRFTLGDQTSMSLNGANGPRPVDPNGCPTGPVPWIPVTPEGNITSRPDPAHCPLATGILYEGNSVKLCLPSKDLKPPYNCTDPIQVQRMFFKRAWITNPTRSYVVFGALAPDTLNGVPDIDIQWAPGSNADPSMQAAAGDPAEALSQGISAYNLLNPDPTSTAIVLAQMSPAEAKSLADSLDATSYRPQDYTGFRTKVNVILSAADPTEATPRLSVDEARYIPVVTPAPVFQNASCLDPLQTDQTQSNPGLSSTIIQDCVARLSYTENSSSLSNTPAKRTLAPAFTAQSADNTFCDNQPTQTWECDVLAKMRKAMYDGSSRWNPDIAILEEKDFDYLRGGLNADSFGAPSSLQVHKALWNAGNLTRVTVLGSTLQSILYQEQQYEARSFQTLQPVRRSKQLRVLGIYVGSGQFYVRGIQLDPSKLYVVATTDNLANGTSDYSALSNQDLNLPQVFWHHEQTVAIADVASNPVQKVTHYARNKLEANYSSPITAKDKNDAAPSVAPIAVTHSNRTLFAGDANPPLSQLEKTSQFEPLWHVVVQQLAGSYSLTKPSQSDQAIGANLFGVTNPNVITPYSDSVSAILDSRFERYIRRGQCRFCYSDWGADLQFNFTRNRLGTITPPSPSSQSQLVTTTGAPVPTTNTSYPGNYFVVSPFFEFQTDLNRHWKPLVLRPGFTSINVASTRQYLSSATANTDFVLDQSRQETVGEAAGTRFEWSDFRYAEFGFNNQKNFNVISSVSVSGQTSCPVSSISSVTGCAMTLQPTGPLTASYSTYTQRGGYWMSIYTKKFLDNPFPHGYSPAPLRRVLGLYQVTAYGNFFAYGKATDSSALTRYAFEINNSLQFTLPANFTFGPNYALFQFQANSHLPGASLHRHSVSAQLNYSFDWHTGMSIPSALVGKTQ